jgi:hypothetical protein
MRCCIMLNPKLYFCVMHMLEMCFFEVVAHLPLNSKEKIKKWNSNSRIKEKTKEARFPSLSAFRPIPTHPLVPHPLSLSLSLHGGPRFSASLPAHTRALSLFDPWVLPISLVPFSYPPTCPARSPRTPHPRHVSSPQPPRPRPLEAPEPHSISPSLIYSSAEPPTPAQC